MKYGPFVGAVFLVSLVVAATLFTGCDNSDTSIPQGMRGAECSVNSECTSNACVYPGICQ